MFSRVFSQLLKAFPSDGPSLLVYGQNAVSSSMLVDDYQIC